MTDRTEDFDRLFVTAAQAAGQDSTRGQPPIATNSSSKHSETAQFSAAASDISREVHLVSSRLQQLTKLVRSNTMFQDPTAQINELSASITDDITNISMQLDNMEEYVASNQSKSAQVSNHSSLIVSQMKTNLLNTTQGFKDILQVRQDNLALQNDRRSRYGGGARTAAAGASSLTSRPPPLAFQSAQNRLTQRRTENTPQLPRPGGVAGEGGGSERAPLIPAMSVEQQQSSQMITMPDQSYLDARAEAMSGIESQIAGIGQLFGRLSTMIQEQGEMVQRIDDNVEDTVMNVAAGQNELIRYYQNLSNNQLLALKVSGILFIFLVFFMFFMA